MSRFILTGLNGYGSHFVKVLLEDDKHELVGVVSSNPKKSEYYEELCSNSIPIYPNIDTCLDNTSADMAIITTPAHIHYREVMSAISHGVSVYCEKPLTTEVSKCLDIISAAKERQVYVAVGFQWSYSDAIQALKEDILNGTFGKIHRISTLVNHYRDKSYYSNSSWKGKIYNNDGSVINDNIISNSAAHFLHNMLFLTGTTKYTSANIDHVKCECFRAHDIDNFDTIMLDMTSDTGIEYSYYGTLVSDNPSPVRFKIKAELADIEFSDDEKIITATFTDGTKKVYGDPNKDRFSHILSASDCISKNTPLLCDAYATLPFQKVVEEIRHIADIKDFNSDDIVRDGNNIYVKGISTRLIDMYNR